MSLLIKHDELGIHYPAMPFIWHYNDFANPYPTHESKFLSEDEFNVIKQKYKHVSDIVDSILIEKEYYLHKQLRMEDFYYNHKSQEVYISFHSWLLKQLEGADASVGGNDYYYKFIFKCQIIPLFGEIKAHKDFPEKIKKTKKKIYATKVGINVSSENLLHVSKLSKRCCIIHKHSGFTRFSPYQMCNFIIPYGGKTNIVGFVSIITDAIAVVYKINKVIESSSMLGDDDQDIEEFEEFEEIKRTKIDKSCVAAHIFRPYFSSDNLEQMDLTKI